MIQTVTLNLTRTLTMTLTLALNLTLGNKGVVIREHLAQPLQLELDSDVLGHDLVHLAR